MRGRLEPCWSPDSRSLGFFATGKMKRGGRDGGAAQVVCDAGWDVAHGHVGNERHNHRSRRQCVNVNRTVKFFHWDARTRSSGTTRHRIRGHRLPHRARRRARQPGTSAPRPLRRPAHLRPPARGRRVPRPLRRRRAHGLPEDDHPEPEATRQYLGEESDDET